MRAINWTRGVLLKNVKNERKISPKLFSRKIWVSEKCPDFQHSAAVNTYHVFKLGDSIILIITLSKLWANRFHNTWCCLLALEGDPFSLFEAIFISPDSADPSSSSVGFSPEPDVASPFILPRLSVVAESVLSLKKFEIALCGIFSIFLSFRFYVKSIWRL